MGRVKIEIKYLESRSNRSATFRKRSNGLLKKARELHVLCGATVELLMIGEDGRQSRYSSAEDHHQSYEVGIGVSNNCMLENDDDEEDEEDDTNDSVTLNNVNARHHVHLLQQQQHQQQHQRSVIVNQEPGYGGQPSCGEVMDYHGMLQQQQCLERVECGAHARTKEDSTHVQMLAFHHQEGIYHGMQHLDPNLHDNSALDVVDDIDLYLDPAIMMDVNLDDGYVSNPADHHNGIFNPTEAAADSSEHSGINEASSTRVSSSMNFLEPKPTTRRRTLMKRRKMICSDNTNHGSLMPACSYPASAAPVKYELDDQSLSYFTMPEEEDMNKFLARF